MTRSFSDAPLTPGVVEALIEAAQRAPSAGNTAGTHFVVLEGPAQTDRYWNVTLPPERRASFPWPGLLRAPVLILPCGDQRAYVERYGEDDKAASGLGESAAAWGIPYWHVDTAMAAMTILHGATARGLGALFFGLFDNEPAVAEMLGLPDGVRPVGTIAVGHGDGGGRPSRSAARGRPPLRDVLHRGGW